MTGEDVEAVIAARLADALMGLATAIMQPVTEAVTGYRDRLIADGWLPEHAQAMAVEYHRLLIHQFMIGTKKR